MGAWANQTISQDTYLGWMSNPEGYDYFVNSVLPDVLTGSAHVLNPAGSNLGPVADISTVIAATTSNGSTLGGLTIPTSILETAKNPPAAAPVATVEKPPVTDGLDALRSTLTAWGLGDLTDFAVKLANQGLSAPAVVDQIRTTDHWKQRFSGIVARQKAGLPAGSEADALSFEQTMHETLAQYGIQGYTQQDYQKWYGEDKSVAEMSRRASIASQWAYAEAPEALAAVNRLYGINAGDITHYVFDADHALPQIQKKLDAAQIAGQAGLAGFGLNAAQAEAVGNYANPASAASQFSKLGQQSQLFKGLPGENGDISVDDLIKGYFGGDQSILNQIRMRNAQRDFGQAGGGVSQSAKGAIGAGAVQPS